MDIAEVYFLLFTDSLVANLAFNPSEEIATHAAKIFRNYNVVILIIVSSTAYLIASIINYCFGIIVYKILVTGNRSKFNPQNDKTNIFKNNKYKFLLPALSAVPFWGKFIILFAGFCRAEFFTSIIIAFVAKLLFYSYFFII